MMSRTTRYLAALALALPLLGCLADTEQVPAYVEIDGFDLTTTPAQGAATEDIREVWVFTDGNFLGAYGLPARIPIQLTGTTGLEFRAGIRVNGVSITPDFYEFYAPVVRTLDLVPEQTISLGTLPLRYAPTAQFALLEDFEPGRRRQFSEALSSGKAIVPQQEIVLSGQASGRIALSDSCVQVEIASATGLNRLTAERQYVFLEVDYLSEAPGIWGLLGQRGLETVPVFDPTFRPRDTWTKLYIDLTPLIGSLGTDDYLLLLRTALPDEAEAANVYLDNLKVIHF